MIAKIPKAGQWVVCSKPLKRCLGIQGHGEEEASAGKEVEK